MNKTNTLVTFLGRGREDRQMGYRTATYRFPDGQLQKTAFLGLELARHLDADSVVILGTSGSMWGVLVESLASVDEDEDARLELLEAETQKTVTQAMLDKVESIMSQAVGLQVVPRLIPFGADFAEQYDILSAIADTVPDGKLSFDLTHGFRHLGMIGFLSAFMLERIRTLQVDHLWYGALDMMRDDIAPVLKLDGLVLVRRWVDALDRFDANGDYGVFVPLLLEDGVPKDKAQCLEIAAFYERTSNDRDAKRGLDTFLPVLNEQLQGASGLFQHKLREALGWTKGEPRSRRQHFLAKKYLERGDFLRAAIFGSEAVVTRECERGGLSPDKHDDRDKVTAAMNQGSLTGKRFTAYRALKDLRNTLAHGTDPAKPESRKLLKDRRQLPTVLAQNLSLLLD